MQADAGQDTHDLPATPGIAPTRIAIGLAQGLLVYLLYRAGTDLAWPATQPLLFLPLLMVAVMAPVIAISGLGQMARRPLLLWLGTAAALIVAFAFYDAWRMEGIHLPQPAPRAIEPSPQLCVFLAAGFFIAHALVLAGAQERRRIAGYTNYFEIAWKLGVQLAFSGLFVGSTWLVLHLGAQLFLLIKLDFLSRAIDQSWFAIPVTTFAFACAMHLTDVRPAIVRGIRNLLLVLLSWILPVLTLLVGGFLASLLFTGLEPLWATRRAAAVLLGAAAAFVVLVNAAWQNGGVQVARPVALAARIAALLLVPVVALAVYALALRVNEHGWTDDRVIAAACMLVASCYAGGYAAAALRKGWLAGLAGVNIAAAFVVLGVLALLFSPVGDPDRLSTIDQLARLRSGAVTAGEFDVGYLHFDAGRYGREALARLEADAAAPQAAFLRARIAAVRKQVYRHHDRALQDLPVLAENLRAWPAGTRLPDSFMKMDWSQVGDELPDCLRRRGDVCEAFLLDLGGSAAPEVILLGQAMENAVLHETPGGAWRVIGTLPPRLANCASLQQALREGRFRALPSAWGDIEIAGQRLPVRQPHTLPPGCTAAPVAGPHPMPVQPDAAP
ncbi:DUF4153 domain-containing protein [Telluria aromaticivorans]|uniref:DUF4153 domain-containing protein n=1 Tax=Telluria aromaticivorans TaxID=2725995 RepID=A0A7Y2P2W9_9BURK|nr:DUF4153 domain-containing protein [Telluria aromaticivorans]NNG25364.1 DUF4153 domain-containing protein [Telluria aromaticivorans]